MNAASLARLRARAKSYMTDACTVRRPGAATADGLGGFTEGTAADTVTVCHRSMQLNRVEQIVAERLGAKKAWSVLLPYDTDIVERDRLIVGSDTLEVVTSGARTEEPAQQVLAVEVE